MGLGGWMYGSAHLHGRSQLSVSSKKLIPSSVLSEHCMHMVHRHTHRQNTHTHNLKMNKSFFETGFLKPEIALHLPPRCWNFKMYIYFKKWGGSWRNGSIIKSLDFSCKGPKFNSKHQTWQAYNHT